MAVKNGWLHLTGDMCTDAEVKENGQDGKRNRGGGYEEFVPSFSRKTQREETTWKI
jgi:hypothetical protein